MGMSGRVGSVGTIDQSSYVAFPCGLGSQQHGNTGFQEGKREIASYLSG